MSKLNTNQKKLIVVIILIIAVILIYMIMQKQNNQFETSTPKNELIPYNEEENQTTNESENISKESQIIIHITGAVNKEGVYTLKENSRISDAINSAEGLRADADTSKINLAYPLEDGMKINVPSVNDQNKNEIETYITNEMITKENKEESDTNKKININTATKEELDTLPGIGESTAQKIINYRKENGKFSNIEEIKEVSGIGESKFENIKELICCQ